MPEFVKLINEDIKPFDFHQNNNKRIIHPGEDAIVPWNIAVSLFGHPRLTDVPPANERTKMYEKIRARHNFSAGLQHESEWEAIRPHVKVIDIEDNLRVIMLIDDPSGARQPDSVPSRPIESDTMSLQRKIDALTAQVTALINRDIANQSEPAQGTGASPTAVQDSPGQASADSGPSTPSTPSAFTIPQPTTSASPDTPQAVAVGASAAAAVADNPPAPAPAPSRRAPAPRNQS